MAQDLDVRNVVFLASYQLNPNTILGVKKEKGIKYLTVINRKDITCWEIIKSWFACGKLAHIDTFSRVGVTKYLCEHNIKILANNQDKNSNEYKAYKTVCDLAHKWIIVSSKEGDQAPDLFFHVGTKLFQTSLNSQLPFNKHLTLGVVDTWTRVMHGADIFKYENGESSGLFLVKLTTTEKRGFIEKVDPDKKNVITEENTCNLRFYNSCQKKMNLITRSI